MPDYSHYTRARRWPRRILYTILVVVLVLVGSAILVRRLYDQNLKPVSGDTQTKVFVVKTGSTPAQIGDGLQKAGLVRSATAFQWYVKNTSLRNKLLAGTYKIAPSYGVIKIANMIAEGKVAVDLITLLPGQRIDQLRQAFIDAKFDPAAVDAALAPSQYADSPALADKPASASLEGFLYPESYQKDANTDPKVIVRAALSEMQKRLTPNVRAAFAARGLSVYQGVTLASVVEREVSNSGDRAQVAQVFFKRIQNGMKLESDVTAFYGAILAGKKPSVDYDSPYNTYIVKGLPIGPISNVTESSLSAVAAPAQTDWTYFVAGDDGKTYFSRTLEEHQALTAKYCKKLCGL